MPEVTICSDCANCFKVNKSDPPWRWLCIRMKRLEGFGFVTRDTWDSMPPYAYCKDINHGSCPMFEYPHEKENTDHAS